MSWPPIEPPPSDEVAWAVAEKALEPGEQLLWAGECIDPTAVDRRLLWPEVATLPACGIGCLAPAGFLMALGGCLQSHLPIALVGGGILFGVAGLMRYLGGNAREKREPFYAITDQRALVLDRDGVVIQAHAQVDPLDVVTEASMESPDLLFLWRRMKGSKAWVQDGFLGIRDAAPVERLLLAASIRAGAQIEVAREDARQSPAWFLTRMLRGAGAASHASAIARLGELDPEALDAVVQNIGECDPLDGALTAALGIVGLWRPLGPRALSLIVRSQYAASGRMRRAGEVALARLGPSAVAPLLRAWAAGDDLLRQFVKASIAGLDDEVLAGGLLSTLVGRDEAAVAGAGSFRTVDRMLRRSVVETRVWRSVPADKRVLSLLRKGPLWARLWAAHALCHGAPPPTTGAAALDVIAEAPAEDPAAAVVRAYHDDARGVPALIECVDGQDPDACEIAARALAQLGEQAAPALGALDRAARKAKDGFARATCRAAAVRIAVAMRGTPAELQAAEAPAGLGTELEAAQAPAGRGTELQAGGTPPGRGTEPAAAAEAAPPNRERTHETPGRG